MGMSTHVVGFVSPDNEEYQKHKKVLIACHEADIDELPKETAEFFGTDYPELYVLDEKLEIEIPITEWGEDMEQGYEIKVADLPVNVDTIRFYNSY